MTYRNNFIGFTNLHVLQEWVEFETKNAGLRVKWDRKVQVPCTTDDTMWLPALNASVTEEDVYKLRGAVIHECNHHRHGKEVFDPKKEWNKIKPGVFTNLLNLVEDCRIDTKQARLFKGDALSLSICGRYQGEALSSALAEAVDKKPVDKWDDDGARFLGCVHTALTSQDEWNVGLQTGTRGFRDLVTSNNWLAADVANKLAGLGYPERIRRLRNPDESWQLVKDLYRDAGFGDPEEDLEKQKQGAQGGETGGDEGGEGQQGEDGETEGKGRKKKKKAKDGDGDPQKNDDKQQYADYLWTNHGQKSGGWGTGSGAAMQYPSKGGFGSTWQPEDPKGMHVVNFTSHKNLTSSKQEKPFSGRARYGRPSIPPEDRTSVGLANTVRRLLQVRAQTEYHSGYKSGSLHKKALFRVAMPTVGDGEFNKRIFRKREEKDTLDCAVMLVVDASGSMDGSKYIHACHSAILLNDVFNRALRIPVEIHSFTTGGDTGKNVIGIIKDFESKPTSSEIRDRFSMFADYMSGNGDPDAVLTAYKRLAQRDEKRKVMIVLSDGSPSYAVSGDPGRGLKELVKEIEGKGVEVHGIGLDTNSVNQFYKSSLVIHESNELEPTLIKLLSKIILNNEEM